MEYKSDNVVKEKSYAFAVRIVRVVQYLQQHKKEFVISKQLLKSGTASGALIREAEYGESKKDFVHKLFIALKEANETEYWLCLLKDTDYLTHREYQSLVKDVIELKKLLTAIIKTTKANF